LVNTKRGELDDDKGDVNLKVMVVFQTMVVKWMKVMKKIQCIFFTYWNVI